MSSVLSSKRKSQIRPTTWILFAGILFYILYIAKTHVLPEHFPHRQFVNTLLLLLCTIFLTGCAFFSLREFFCKTDFLRLHFYQAFLAGMLIFVLFFCEQAKYFMINREINKFDNHQNYLPEIVEKARTVENPKARKLYARVGYIFYGVRLSFRGDDNNWTYYDPPTEEIADRQSVDTMESSLRNLRVLSLGLFNGEVDVVFSMFLTLFFCLLWAGYRKTEDKPAPQLSP